MIVYRNEKKPSVKKKKNKNTAKNVVGEVALNALSSP